MNTELLQALQELEKDKGIAGEVLLEALEAALLSAYKKNFGSSENAKIYIDRETGEYKVLSQKTVVENVEDEQREISLEVARAINPNMEPGDIVEEEVTPRNFGRIAAQTAKQVVIQRIREAERGVIYSKFMEREEDIITGVIQRHEQKNIFIDLGKTEAIMPPSEQIPGEEYKQGDRIKAYIVEVRKTTKGPQITVSRTHPGFLKRLFELEVPEIHDGLVEIVSISREPGSRSKIAVNAREEKIDPVGSCVGPRGMRVQTVVNELKGEKIDIIRWSSDPCEYVANSLSPAKVIKVYVNEILKSARAVVPNNQLSLAIGKEGQNARLAAKLTGWKIDIKSESQFEDLLALEEELKRKETIGEADQFAEEKTNEEMAGSDIEEGKQTQNSSLEED